MMANRLGVKHWVFQRVSNALIVIFGVVLAATLVSGVTFESLQETLANPVVKAYLVITLVFACLNSVLAGWQIAGDYANKFGFNAGVMVGFVAIVSAAYFVCGLTFIF